MVLVAEELPIVICGEQQSFSYSPQVYSILVQTLLKRLQRSLRVRSLEESLRELPVVAVEEWEEERKISFLVCSYRHNQMSYRANEILSRWLVPGKRLETPLLFSADFALVRQPENLFAITETVLAVENEADWEIAKQILPLLQEEIRLGMRSSFHGNRLFELKGLSADEKGLLVQDKVLAFVRRLPRSFDSDLSEELEKFFLTASESFKSARSCAHLARMVLSFYLLYKQIDQHVDADPSQRKIVVRTHLHSLQTPLGERRVLSLIVAFNHLKEHEVFREKHLLRSVQALFSDAQLVPGSVYEKGAKESGAHILYVEVERKSGFSLQEIRMLQERGSSLMDAHIERLVSPVFMPRNEEEVMRNIVALTQQLKYVHDLPQVSISFAHQDENELIFTLVMVRLVDRCGSPGVPLQQLFETSSSDCHFSLERSKRIGMLRKKYPKEATVWRVQLKSWPFLREDRSLDLYRARERVKETVQMVVGEVRDYNGGMISKQAELFASLKRLLGEVEKEHQLLLESFFYALFPVESRSVIDPEVLKTFFLLFLEAKNRAGELEKSFKTTEDERRLFALISLQDRQQAQQINAAVDRLCLRAPALTTLHLSLSERIFIGYIYICDEKEKKNIFLNTLEESLTFDPS